MEKHDHNAAYPKRNQDTSHEARFLEAFDLYSDALFRHVQLRVSDRERAVDLVHDTFTKAWTYLRQGHEIEAFRPFLYKVLNNLIVDSYRKRDNTSLDSIMEQEGVDESAFGELSEDTSESLADTIDGKQAFTLLDRLPETYKEVIIFRYVDGLGPREISELTETSENVVSVRIHRGLKMLREYIEAESASREERRHDSRRRQQRNSRPDTGYASDTS